MVANGNWIYLKLLFALVSIETAAGMDSHPRKAGHRLLYGYSVLLMGIMVSGSTLKMLFLQSSLTHVIAWDELSAGVFMVSYVFSVWFLCSIKQLD